jgi:hypothetical protein
MYQLDNKSEEESRVGGNTNSCVERVNPSGRCVGLAFHMIVEQQYLLQDRVRREEIEGVSIDWDLGFLVPFYLSYHEYTYTHMGCPVIPSG